MLTQQRANELLQYDPDSGYLFWKKDRYRRVKSGDIAGSMTANGYVAVCVDNERLLAHRIIWLMKYGKWPCGIDHINGDPSDNRLENLMEGNQSVNMKNSKLPAHNTSGTVGVYWFKPTKQWTASIQVNGIQHCLGYFDDKSEAIAKRKQAEKQYRFHKNHGRTTTPTGNGAISRQDRPHGTRARYRKGCRCEMCIEGTRAYFRNYYHQHRAKQNA